MTRQDAADLYGWLENSYPRNYKDVSPRQMATTIDNLMDAFGPFPYTDVIAEYKRVFRNQKNEPHPSEIRKGLKMETAAFKTGFSAEDAYEKLKTAPKYAEISRAYGERATRRAAKLCTQTATIRELLFRLEHDIPCKEGDFRHKYSQ